MKKQFTLLACSLLFVGCTSASPEPSAATETPVSLSPPAESSTGVFYEVFVRSFADSNGDGIGDLNGLIGKLDYLDRLGVDGLWLMPIQPSPSYHGYDVSDYYDINPEYGTMDDFRKLIEEAHRRDIRIIMDLVVNHTSSQHPWFIDSAKGPDSSYRNWYTWLEEGQSASPTDGATGSYPWHETENGQYLGIFWGGMPDLNFDNPNVRKEMIAIGQYWLKEGVDGFRLDAAKHIYGKFKSTEASSAVQEKNVSWWQEFRQGLNAVKPDAYLVGEVWDGASIVAPYLNNAFDSTFNFDLASELLGIAVSEQSSSIGFTLPRLYEFYAKNSNGKFVDAPFLSNHDQTRVMSAVGGNVNYAKLAASLLLTLPGNVFLYNGEELGVSGFKPDERLREPFPWTRKEGTPGETTWEDSFYRSEEASVEAQEADPNSILNHYRRLISWRAQEPALRGSVIAPYDTENDHVTSYIRSNEEEQVLVLHNMSKQPQTVSLANDESQQVFSKLELTTDPSASMKDQSVSLPPYASAVLKP
ncbi:alpha-amylase family glycosyl hydrolase [Paenibacillaceae bacterium WGS1546]|uniref:alpha-amylase family glycosyl hydrolase n=1 Tax=Cohnella sp. WGS1546 TaxID=3366810 RepID=UPI00372D41C9